MFGFKVLDPSGWFSLQKLLLLYFIVCALYLFSLLNYKSPLNLALTSLLVATICIKIKTIINSRYEAHKIFDKGNVPSVPFKDPFTGNLFEMLVPNSNIKIQEDYHKRLGKTYGMFYGPDPWVLTIDLDLLQRVFVSEGHKYVDVTQFRLPFMNEISKSLAQLRGDTWRRQRKTLDPFFSQHQMRKDNVYDDIERACTKLLETIRAHPCEPNSSTFPESSSRIVDINYNFKKFSIQVIFQVAFGLENGVNMAPNEKDELVESIHESANEVRGPFVWTCIALDGMERLFGKLIRFTKVGKYIKYIHEILDESLRRRREVFATVDKSERKMIDTIIECIDSNKMDLESVRSNLFLIFLAGFETSANTLTILCWYLAKMQFIQEKLRAAIAVEGEKALYLDWCIQETLRLYPAVPSAIGRILSDDIEHNGMKFFKGTTINASIYTIHRWRDYWGADVEEFRPERFGELKLHPAQYFAFGIGPRYCIGMNLAMAELRAITARILLKYRLEFCELTPAHLPVSSPNMIHMILNGQISVRFVELSSL